MPAKVGRAPPPEPGPVGWSLQGGAGAPARLLGAEASWLRPHLSLPLPTAMGLPHR